MIKLEDVIYALVERIKAIMPTAAIYLGKLAERPRRPCFLLLPVYVDGNRSSYFTKDVVIDLQMVYFGEHDGYGSQSFEDKMRCMSRLQSFFDGFVLRVVDRTLRFRYDFGEADKQLTVNIKFTFKDDVVNLQYSEELLREKIKNIIYNEKELI